MGFLDYPVNLVTPTAGKMDESTPGNSIIVHKVLDNLSAEQAIKWLRLAPVDGDIFDDDGNSLPFCIFSGTNGSAKILPFEYRWTFNYRDNPTVTLQTGSSTKQVRLSVAIAELGKDAKYLLQNVRGRAPMASARVITKQHGNNNKTP